MKWKILLTVFLLLSIASTVVAVNQLQNKASMPLSETDVGINQPQSENSAPSPETNPIDQSQDETNTALNDTIILDKVFNGTFKLTMIIPKNTYALGEPVNVTLRLTNLSNESVTIYHPWMGLLSYSVLNQSGHLVHHKTEAPGEIALMVWVDETLKPNMTHEKLFIWRQVYTDRYYYDETYRFVECPITIPGTYTIIGRTYFLLNDIRGPLLEANLQIEIQIT